VSYLGYKEREIAVRGRAIIESIQSAAEIRPSVMPFAIE
jgi:hypothetical protein